MDQRGTPRGGQCRQCDGVYVVIEVRLHWATEFDSCVGDIPWRLSGAGHCGDVSRRGPRSYVVMKGKLQNAFFGECSGIFSASLRTLRGALISLLVSVVVGSFAVGGSLLSVGSAGAVSAAQHAVTHPSSVDRPHFTTTYPVYTPGAFYGGSNPGCCVLHVSSGQHHRHGAPIGVLRQRFRGEYPDGGLLLYPQPLWISAQ